MKFSILYFWLGLSLVLGTVAGAVFGNIAVGAGAGVAVGAGVGFMMKKKS